MRTEAQTWSEAAWTQYRRISESDPSDPTSAMQALVDFHFLLMALNRLRRAAALAATVPSAADDLNRALADFDRAVPALGKLRDTGEHFDDYTLNRGRRQGVQRWQLQNVAWDVRSLDGSVIYWLGEQLNAFEAASAATQLSLVMDLASCRQLRKQQH